MKKPQPIIPPALVLRYCSVDEHCEALRKIKKAWFWWFMGMTSVPWNFSVPFPDGDGRWWYQVKPGLCWPVDFFKPGDGRENTIPFPKKFLGYQEVVRERDANSRLIINAIEDISSFGPESIPDKRRNMRTGIGSCTFELLERPNKETYVECAALWRDFTGRTAWKKAVGSEYIARTWEYLLDVPGTSIIIGREKNSGKVAGFLIVKIIGDTAYIDTIASSTALMKTKVNDALVFAFLENAKALPGVKKAHYSIISYKQTLERFKQSHGFRPVSYPARTFLMQPAGMLIKRLNAVNYNRMIGNIEVPFF